MRYNKEPHNKALHQTKGAWSGRFAAGHLEAPFAGEGRCYPVDRSPIASWGVLCLSLFSLTQIACGSNTVPDSSVQADARSTPDRLPSNVVPNSAVETDARPTPDHPLAGFWKLEDCSQEYGLAIGPMEKRGEYYVSFCGHGGCFAKGTYRPITSIYGDPDYKVESLNVIEVARQDGFRKHVRCAGRVEERPL